jgi:LysM repeat protein
MRFLLLFCLMFCGVASAALKLFTLADVTVTTAGTRVQVSGSDLYVYSVSVQAKKANTGKIYVGDSSVSSSRGYQLEPGEVITLNGFDGKATEEFNVTDLYVDATVNGEGVHVTYLKKRP